MLKPWRYHLFKLVCALIFGWMFSSNYLILHLSSAQETFRDDLFSVSFPNEKNGWACGRWGMVVQTSNGGKTWIRQKTGTNNTLVSIFFMDSRNGWAVGDGGTIIHTMDGGISWEKQTSPVPYYLMDIHFVSPSKGWIVTERTHILSTDDGGNNWTIQFQDGDYILKALSFCDQLHGWAVGEHGYIYHTDDGGTIWEKQAGYFGLVENEILADPSLFDVVAVSPQEAWAVGMEGHVTRTTDGGMSWRTVNTGAPKTHLFGIATDKKETIVIGGRGIFLYSVDMGGSWKVAEFQPPIKYGWLYGLTQRTSSEFMVVGWAGAIYRNSSLNLWKRVNP